MDELANNNEDRFNREKSYQERPIIHSLEKEYASVNRELSNFHTTIQSLLLCFNNLRKFILQIDSSRSKYAYLHNILDKGLENISRDISFDLICVYFSFISM